MKVKEGFIVSKKRTRRRQGNCNEPEKKKTYQQQTLWNTGMTARTPEISQNPTQERSQQDVNSDDTHKRKRILENLAMPGKVEIFLYAPTKE